LKKDQVSDLKDGERSVVVFPTKAIILARGNLRKLLIDLALGRERQYNGL